jgi:hypothetical protein
MQSASMSMSGGQIRSMVWRPAEVSSGARLHVRREMHPVELLQRSLAGGNELALFRRSRAGDGLSETQAVQHRQRLPIGVGVLNGKASQIRCHARVDVEGEQDSTISRIGGECQALRLLRGWASQRYVPPQRSTIAEISRWPRSQREAIGLHTPCYAPM